jgi:hypothetical protein
MSKPNKANKDHYMQGGRLSQDDMARERQRQATISRRGKDRVTAKARNAAPASSRRRTSRGE